jgi:hypothetical protein
MYAYVRNNPLNNTDPNGRDCQNGFVACGNYILGGVGAVVNAFSSGIINAPNRILDAAISAVAPSSTFRFGDVVPDAFTPLNSEQRQGLDSANAVMIAAPLAEAGATALMNAVGTGARVEAGTAAATATRQLFNPFKGKTPEQVGEMFEAKGFEPRGPDPVGGKGGYVNPATGRSYHIDPGGTYKKGVEPPHVDVNRSKTSDLPKRKFPTEDDLNEH